MSHSCVLAPHLKDDLAASGMGKYTRMFPDLPPLVADEAALLTLGRTGSRMDAPMTPDRGDAAEDNPAIPAGWPFFGQFIAHDITADRSLLAHHARTGELHNFRVPALDLECIYGPDPTGMPFFFDQEDADKFLLGLNDAGLPNDVPRNRQGVGLVGDKRNDSQMLISQLHVAFLKFHNAVVDHVRTQGIAPGDVFTEAQRLARWHYQWIVAHEYLPLVCGDEIVADILARGAAHYRYSAHPQLPVEFADAVYRFGHSQIRAVYQLNEGTAASIFPQCLGGCPVPQAQAVDWRFLFALDAARPPQPSKRIDTTMVHPLIDLPEAITGAVDVPEYRSLAVRDLQRARALDLPSGEAVARAMGAEPLTAAQIGLAAFGWEAETPLWYYALKEAEVVAGGRRLGPVGGRIVAEVLLGLIGADAGSYMNADTDWTPTLPAAQSGAFTMADLLRFATG